MMRKTEQSVHRSVFYPLLVKDWIVEGKSSSETKSLEEISHLSNTIYFILFSGQKAHVVLGHDLYFRNKEYNQLSSLSQSGAAPHPSISYSILPSLFHHLLRQAPDLT